MTTTVNVWGSKIVANAGGTIAAPLTIAIRGYDGQRSEIVIFTDSHPLTNALADAINAVVSAHASPTPETIDG